MESLIIILVLVIMVIIIVRWRQSVRYLKNLPIERPTQNSDDSEAQATVTFTSRGPAIRDVELSEEEIAVAADAYGFVAENKRPKQLTGTQPWFKERNHKKFLRDDPDRAFDWVRPFISDEIAQHEALRELILLGPSAGGIRKKYES
jgi:hypothetical protein